MAPIGPIAEDRLSHLDLVRAAVMAPSPDNNQPWRFVSRGEQLLVYLDPQRALPSDVKGMFDLTGVGAAIENACIAARQMGYEPLVEYGLQPFGPIPSAEPVAAINCVRGGKPDPLFAQLATRCTCRKRYSTSAVDEGSLGRLAEAAQGFPEVQLGWIAERSRIRAFARLIAATDRIRFEYEPFHNELCRQLRFTAEEAERTRDGLDVRTLELPPGAGAMLRWLRPWARMKWVHRLGLGRLLTVPSVLSVRRSGTLGLLSVSEPTSAQFLQGGRAVQRMWLAADAEGLAFQPLGSLSIFFAHVEILQGKRLSPAHDRRIRQLIERFRELVPSAGKRVVLLLFRLGRATPTRFRSLRRPAEEVWQSS